MITNASGTITAESDYYPWGGELQFVSNDSHDYKFTGKKRDVETGLDYLGARYYSNWLGRWTSANWSATPAPVPYADLGDPQSLNLYGFVGGNPASKVDQDGHCCSWSASSIADWLDTKIDAARSAINDAAVNSGHASLAGYVTFQTNNQADALKGATDLLRLGNSIGSLPENATTTQKVIAVSEEGGRVGGIILTVIAVAGPKGAAAPPSGDTLKPGAYAGKGVPASGPRITATEQRAVNAEGAQTGCHTVEHQHQEPKRATGLGIINLRLH